MSFVLFIHQLCFVIISPNLWFYLIKLEKVDFYGIIWSVYFLGQMISIPFWKNPKLLGFHKLFRKYRENLDDKLNKQKIDLIISSVLGIIAGLIYSYCNIYAVLTSRFLQGIASGSSIAIISENCQKPLRQRTKTLSHLYFWQYFGYLLGPGIGWLLSYLPSTFIYWPGYSGLFISFSYLIMLFYILFTNPIIIETNSEGSLIDIRYGISRHHSSFRLLIFNLTNYFLFFLLAIYDCLITPITLYVYHFDLFTQSLSWIIVGSVISFSFIILIQLHGKISDLVLYQGYLTIQLIGVVLLLEMNISIFFLALTLISLSISGCLILNLSIYSKELRPNESGFFLCLFLMTSCLGRIMGSIFFEFLYKDLYQIFVTLSITSLVSLILLTFSNLLLFTIK